MIEKGTEGHILALAKRIKVGVEFDFENSSGQYFLNVYSEDQRPHIIILSRELISDFDMALQKHKNSSYFYSMENRLKWEICLGLADKELFPDILVSDEMIREKGQWQDPSTSANNFTTSFDEKMTLRLLDGFIYISNSLDTLIVMSKPLQLEDIEEEKKELDNFLQYYRDQQSFNSSGVSVGSLQYLKAAAVGKILELETKKWESAITRIVQAIDEEIYDIVGKFCAGVFWRIKLPDFMVSIKELSGASPTEKAVTESIMVATLSQVDHYDIAFSLAHEQHDYVDKVFYKIRELEPTLKVFYYRDEEQEVKLWGRNMVPHLQKIYRDQSDHVIIFVSKEYVKKRWALQEWRSVQEAILDRPEEYLLPARFDDAYLEGLHTTINYIDLRKKTPVEFAEMIVAKIKSRIEGRA